MTVRHFFCGAFGARGERALRFFAGFLELVFSRFGAPRGALQLREFGFLSVVRGARLFDRLRGGADLQIRGARVGGGFLQRARRAGVGVPGRSLHEALLDRRLERHLLGEAPLRVVEHAPALRGDTLLARGRDTRQLRAHLAYPPQTGQGGEHGIVVGVRHDRSQGV